MRVDEFNYHLPPELIAQDPLPDRTASRMLVLRRETGDWEDGKFADLPSYLAPGDCLVLNNSRVLPSRLFATRTAGPARIEVFLVKALSKDNQIWQALVRPGRKVAAGERLRFSDALFATVCGRGEHGERTIRFEGEVDVVSEIERIGHVPLPPYIRREDSGADRSRYQTVYADPAGSVAAPTAGLHFDSAMLQECHAAGADLAWLTLHVGLGTFAPLHAETLDEVQLHFERYAMTRETLATIRNAQRRIAVGTTSVRTLETVYQNDELVGETNLFIHPGFEFHAADAVLTNFHLPCSSLLMLVSAFAGVDLTLAAYRHAVEQQYRFFSYGDCMLIL